MATTTQKRAAMPRQVSELIDPSETRYRLTVDEYERLGEVLKNPRVELIDGILVCKMTKKPLHVVHGKPGRFAWQSGYGAFSMSFSQLDALRDYVANQQDHHRTRSFQDEHRDFLNKHEIEYDERYLWG